MRLEISDGRSLRSGFLASAARHPDATALVVEGVALSYGVLEATARTWAGVICAALGRVPERVGVFAYRSKAAYIGVLAGLMSGGAFVPLNPKFPIQRTRSMIEFGLLDAIIVDKTAYGQIVEIAAQLVHCPLILVVDGGGEELHGEGRIILGVADILEQAALKTLPPVLPEQTAYLVFTSGSTGTPKGVPVTHANVLHFIDVMMARYHITSDDRFSQTFDQTFDLSVCDLFLAWEGGASVYAMRSLDLIAPTRFITHNALTVWFSVPSIPALMRKKGFLKPNAFPRLRLSLFCGEPLPAASAEAWQAAAPNAVLENLYGPTELTIACLVHRWEPETSPALCVNGTVPIGRPNNGLGVMVLDEYLNPITDNSKVGELCVCGPQTVPGYWQDPVKTAERFVLLPVSPVTTQRFYRTGDRVARLEGGDFVYLGRVDHQIKLRGYRVELGEVEAAMRASEGVVEAIAIGWPLEEEAVLGIVGFVSGTNLDMLALQEEMRRRLPDYMVPREIRVVETMPLNANGKIDRKALQAALATGGSV